MNIQPGRVAFAHTLVLIGLAAGGARAAAQDTTTTTATTAADTADEAGLSNVERLGRRIFNDTRLSVNGTQACSSCHVRSQAFTGNAQKDASFPVAAGALPGALGTRNAPTAMYMSFSPEFGFVVDEEGFTPMGGQFWDGRVDTLAAQAQGPFLNPREMAMPSKAAVIDQIAKGPYAALFKQVYGKTALQNVDQAYTQVGDAVEAFENTPRFHPFSSKFDAMLRGQAKLSAQEQRGFGLFKDPSKGNCIACHAGNPSSSDPREWLFTDFTYDNLGVPRNTTIPDNRDPNHFDLGLCAQPGLAAKVPAGAGAPDAFVASLCGAFKVPTLRNIAETAPYMHNGYFKRLQDVVEFYVTRDTNPGRWYPSDGKGGFQKFNDLPLQYAANVNTSEAPYDRKPGQAPRLSASEISDVVAFLRTLSDGYKK